jgi:nitrate reductase beta subunit
LIGGYAQLAYFFNYIGPTGNNRDEVTMIRKRTAEGGVLMKVMAQMAMVMNLDKCIGCHTCSVTCKQAWTNRDRHRIRLVQQRRDPTLGLATRARYEDQEKWQGGWVRKSRMAAWSLKAGGRRQEAAQRIFSNPKLPLHRGLLRAVDLRLRDLDQRASAADDFPVARPKSLISGKDMNVSGRPTGMTTSVAPTQ